MPLDAHRGVMHRAHVGVEAADAAVSGQAPHRLSPESSAGRQEDATSREHLERRTRQGSVGAARRQHPRFHGAGARAVRLRFIGREWPDLDRRGGIDCVGFDQPPDVGERPDAHQPSGLQDRPDADVHGAPADSHRHTSDPNPDDGPADLHADQTPDRNQAAIERYYEWLLAQRGREPLRRVERDGRS